MTRTKFLIELENYWRMLDKNDMDWSDEEVNSIDLFDACQKLGFFK
jgi:hypothetical protein